MCAETLLNELEYFLLFIISMGKQEPMAILYRDARKLITGTKINSVINALLKLTDLGFIECFWVKHELKYWEPIAEPTFEDLKTRYKNYTRFEKKTYPEFGDYWFEITKNGKLEEVKAFYDVYHPFSASVSNENKRPKSIEQVIRVKTTGRLLRRHEVVDKNGEIIHAHYRIYPNEFNN
jgi:hypothetical protein